MRHSNSGRTESILFLCAMWVLSDYALQSMHNEYYFAVAALFDFAIVLCLPMISNSRLILDLQYINYAALIMQFAGWILYLLYSPAVIYNSFMGALLIAQTVRLIWIGPADDNIKNNHVGCVVYRSDTASRGLNFGASK